MTSLPVRARWCLPVGAHATVVTGPGSEVPAAVLADRRAFAIDDAAWSEFLTVLDRPVSHKPRLEKLLTEPSIFTEG